MLNCQKQSIVSEHVVFLFEISRRPIEGMFRWYEASSVCYVYLADIWTWNMFTKEDQFWEDNQQARFKQSRWFTRGWTLQEMIAPANVEFYAKDWTEIGSKFSISNRLARITNVEESLLRGQRSLHDYNVAERMSWAAKRKTTREEDLAYCLMGIFDVNMPLLYGEGQRAFIRLQEEIMKTTEDYTIFAWTGGNQGTTLIHLTYAVYWRGPPPTLIHLAFHNLATLIATCIKSIGQRPTMFHLRKRHMASKSLLRFPTMVNVDSLVFFAVNTTESFQ